MNQKSMPDLVFQNSGKLSATIPVNSSTNNIFCGVRNFQPEEGNKVILAKFLVVKCLATHNIF